MKVKIINKDNVKLNKRIYKSLLRKFYSIKSKLEKITQKQINVVPTLIFSRTQLLNKLNNKIQHEPEMMVEGSDIYINYLKISNRNNFLNLINHEFVHVLTNQVNSNIDLWLGEGLACYYSNKKMFKHEKEIEPFERLKHSFDFSLKHYYSAYKYVEFLMISDKSIVNQLLNGTIDIEIQEI